jgi:hypothetical protein
MKIFIGKCLFAVSFSILIAGCCDAQLRWEGHHRQGKVGFKTLLEEMLNREALAKFPEQWSLYHQSSYDRRSVAKGKDGWYANDDWDNWVGEENGQRGKQFVLLDVDGPGVLTRFWVGGHPQRKAYLRFYIDGQSTPFWEADHTAALIGQNKWIGFPLSLRSVDEVNAGDNLYAPIPFAHHLKITYQKPKSDEDTRLWYNIDYRIYKPNVSVKSFSKKTPKKYLSALKKTNGAFLSFMKSSPDSADAPGERQKEDLSFTLDSGSSKSIVLNGPGSVRRLLLRFHAANMKAVVGHLWLHISFDGKETIKAPVGFFFGCGDQLVKVANWYSKVDVRGNMASYWVMPYRHKAVIRIVNAGNQRISGSLTVATGRWKWDSNSMYFHAAFNRIKDFSTVAEKGREFNFLNIPRGTGVYVGDVLQVSKPVGGWWGEGDEKIYVDDSIFPRDFGTGTEDYYGYSWGNPQVFNHAFFSTHWRSRLSGQRRHNR